MREAAVGFGSEGVPGELGVGGSLSVPAGTGATHGIATKLHCPGCQSPSPARAGWGGCCSVGASASEELALQGSGSLTENLVGRRVCCQGGSGQKTREGRWCTCPAGKRADDRMDACGCSLSLSVTGRRGRQATVPSSGIRLDTVQSANLHGESAGLGTVLNAGDTGSSRTEKLSWKDFPDAFLIRKAGC